MSDNNNDTVEELNEQVELDALKERASLMGIKFSNNIGVETLRKKISDKMAGITEDSGDADVGAEGGQENPLESEEDKSPVDKMSPMELRTYLQRECMKLIRCRITNLDPKKKDLNGEIFTVANEFIGNVTKYVPYGEASHEGYHLPKVLYDELESRRFLSIRTVKDPVTKQERVETTYAKEFAIEVLPQLTKGELAKLAAAQKAAGS